LLQEEKLKTVKTWENGIARDNYKELKKYRTHSFTWRSTALKMENARFGRQFSRAEEEAILKFRQAPLPISVSTAICDTADAMMLSAQPTVHVAPIINPYNPLGEKLSKEIAQKYSYLLQKAWYDSLGNLHLDRIFRDYTNVGHGILYVAPRQENGFQVDFSHLPWKYFYADPSSKDPLYKDAENLIYAFGINERAAYRFVQSIEPDLSFEKFKEYWVEGQDSTEIVNFEEDSAYGATSITDMVLFCTRTTLENDRLYRIYPKVKDVNYQGELGFQTYSELTPDLIRLRNEGKIEIHVDNKPCLVEYTSIGSLGYKVKYPIDTYNMIPLVYDHRDTPFPYGRMWYLYPLQRALNRFVMSAILNMSILNSTRILAEEGSIVNENDYVMNASMPGVVLKYKLQTPGMSQPPVVIPAMPMSEAWLHMPKWLTYMMEYISGISSVMMGDPKGAPDVFSTVASLQSMGSQKTKRRAAAADVTLSQAGRVAGAFYQHYAPFNGYTIHWTPNDQNNPEQVIKFNEVDMSEEIDGNGEKKFKPYIKPETDLRTGFRDVRFTSIASSGYEAATEAVLMANLATQLKIPALAKPIIKRLNIADADKVADDIDYNLQAEQMLADKDKQIKDMEAQSKILINQIRQLSVSLEAAQVGGRIKEELTKFKSNPEKYISESYSANNSGQQI
jgi:hypothetical protein